MASACYCVNVKLKITIFIGKLNFDCVGSVTINVKCKIYKGKSHTPKKTSNFKHKGDTRVKYIRPLKCLGDAQNKTPKNIKCVDGAQYKWLPLPPYGI